MGVTLWTEQKGFNKRKKIRFRAAENKEHKIRWRRPRSSDKEKTEHLNGTENIRLHRNEGSFRRLSGVFPTKASDRKEVPSHRKGREDQRDTRIIR